MRAGFMILMDLYTQQFEMYTVTQRNLPVRFQRCCIGS